MGSPVKGAGAKIIAVWNALPSVRWRRFASVRFLGATLVATALVQLVPNTANAPSGAAQAAANQTPYVGFSVALRDAYGAMAEAEGETLGTDFDRTILDRSLKALDARLWPDPQRPLAFGLTGPTGIAVDEARLRLIRLYALGARELHPPQAAGAQTALECWALRAALRRDAAAIAECRDRFFAGVTALEDGLLPLRTQDPFHRTLAREYLAYAHYKAAIEGDQIDARHFADKGLRAAEAQPVEPEELERWFAFERGERRDLSLWRIRLELALEKHRAGPRAVAAALALARYDCWVDRAAEHARPAEAAKCRGEFIDAMREIEETAARSETVAIRFGYDRLSLGAEEHAKIARAAHEALERNATISVSALASPRGKLAVEARQAWRRAETVAEALAALGVPAERIRMVQRASLANENEAGLRRVDIVLD
jgi:outer membrane protein OmpA-like peptidoglycan-associated protein